jgi:hypothetical protein
MPTPFFPEVGGQCFPAYDELGELAACDFDGEFMQCSDCGLIRSCPGQGRED